MPHRESEISKRVKAIEKTLLALGPEYIRKWTEDLSRLETQDLPQLEVIGHKLKGNAKTFGYPQLGVLGAELEEASKCRNKKKTSEILIRIMKLLKSLNSTE